MNQRKRKHANVPCISLTLNAQMLFEQSSNSFRAHYRTSCTFARLTSGVIANEVKQSRRKDRATKCAMTCFGTFCQPYGNAENRRFVRDLKKKAAFTLAEVLITLGIIGIVAAMTLPTVINNTRHKELETAFKKSYANLANAVNLVNAEEIPVYVLNPTEERPDGDPDANSAYAQAILSNYRQLKKLTPIQKTKYHSSMLNYSRKRTGQFPQCSQSMNADNAFVTMDGSMLSIMQNCGALWFTIDTNGLKKPNALGHDIFIFRIDKNSTNNALKPAYSESEIKLDDEGNKVYTENGIPVYNNTEENKDKCSPTSPSALNGATCANFAILDRCPGDESKGYFECLP